ncbi:Uncharacterised protein [Chlamydia trachomatis]|nr:Uncharacterised protein [Chlamydia trachomatis]
MVKTTDQAIFDEVILIGQELGYDMYPSLPKDEVPYPFINLLDVQLLPKSTKTHLKGKYSLALTVWGREEERILVSEMTAKLMQAVSAFQIGDWRVALHRQGSTYHIYEERQSDVSTLWRSDMSLEFVIL